MFEGSLAALLSGEKQKALVVYGIAQDPAFTVTCQAFTSSAEACTTYSVSYMMYVQNKQALSFLNYIYLEVTGLFLG